MRNFLLGIILTLLGFWVYQSDQPLAIEARYQFEKWWLNHVGESENEQVQIVLEKKLELENKLEIMRLNLSHKVDIGQERIEQVSTALDQAQGAFDQINNLLESFQGEEGAGI